MKHWYIIAYDIRDKRRLSRTHYYLSKRAIALQNSVFLLRVNKRRLQWILKGLKARADYKVDDIRLYPVSTPYTIWAAGKQASNLSGLYGGGKPAKASSKFKQFIKSLFGGSK